MASSFPSIEPVTAENAEGAEKLDSAGPERKREFRPRISPMGADDSSSKNAAPSFPRRRESSPSSAPP
ncbi:MAG: hypothetical protein WD069_08235, partial [Planctomycetales bacterium]